MRLQPAFLVVIQLLACSQSPASRRASEKSGEQTLVGAWDASMSLTHPYQLEMRDPPQRRICGAIGFIQAANGQQADAPQLLGVYSLDLGAIGLGGFGGTQAPIASAGAESAGGETPSDTLTITIRPADNELIVLRGARGQDEIRGGWTARSVRGNASGSFELRRHRATETSTNC